jgi:hypothetical protein
MTVFEQTGLETCAAHIIHGNFYYLTQFVCHAERSEASIGEKIEILCFAQDDELQDNLCYSE